MKTGIDHVVPPLPYLERMLTLRIHLDDAGPDNAPLLVAPGSHRLGRIAEPDIAQAVDRLGAEPRLAAAADVGLPRPDPPRFRARQHPRCRRVVQLFCTAETYPAASNG